MRQARREHGEPSAAGYRDYWNGAEIVRGLWARWCWRLVSACCRLRSATALGGESDLPASDRAESADVLVAQAQRAAAARSSPCSRLGRTTIGSWRPWPTAPPRSPASFPTIRPASGSRRTPGTDASDLALARGEPAGFAAAVEFGLAVLARMSEGQFELRDGAITLEGRTKTGADYAAIEAMAPPQGLDLAMGGVRPPLADPFVWTAEKNEEGGVRFSGFVPGELVRAAPDGSGVQRHRRRDRRRRWRSRRLRDVRDRRSRRARNPAVRAPCATMARPGTSRPPRRRRSRPARPAPRSMLRVSTPAAGSMR